MERNPNCTLCPLHQGVNTVCIAGKGNPESKIWLLGEAPGFNEDQTGIPFVGDAGDILHEQLELAGIDASDIYITNSVRCRPPKNRRPTNDEIKTCSQAYLFEELKEYKPEYVVTLGGVALQAVMGRNMAVNKARGSVMAVPLKEKVKHVKHFKNGNVRETWKDETIHEVKVFPTYHPSFAGLRNPAYLPLLASDLHSLKRMIDHAESGEVVHYVECTTPSQVMQAYATCLKSKTLSFDLETYGQPNAYDFRNTDYKILSCAISPKPGVCYVIGIEHPDNPSSQDPKYVQLCKLVLKSLLETQHDPTRQDVELIAHNALYDCFILRGHFGIDVNITYDTMIVAFLLNENEPHGLKRQAPRWLGVSAWEDNIIWQKNGMMLIPEWDILWPYNAKDTDYTLRLFHFQKQHLDNQPKIKRLFYALLLPALKALIQLQMNGLWLDRERIKTRIQQTKDNRAAQEQIVKSYVPFDRRETFKIDSTPDLQWLLYDHRKMPILRTTKKGAPSTDKESLTQLEDLYSNEQDIEFTNGALLKAIREYRKWAKYEGTYLKKWLNVMTLDGWVYPKYNMAGGEKNARKGKDEDAGVVTGRLSGDYQQIPRDPFLRSCIGAPPGYVLADLDLSQIELRLVAHEAGEAALIDAYRTGKDVHALMARRLLEMGGTNPDTVDEATFKKYRTLAKGVNFGFLYGMEWPKFIRYMRTAFSTVVTEDEARQARRAFFEMWPRLVNYHRRQEDRVRHYKKVENLIGRVRRLPDIDSEDRSIQSGVINQAINSPIQSLGSDILLMAMVEIHEKYKDDPNIMMVLTFHDALFFYIKEDVDVQSYVKDIKSIMERPKLFDTFELQLLVPVVADYHISKHWSE